MVSSGSVEVSEWSVSGPWVDLWWSMHGQWGSVSIPWEISVIESLTFFLLGVKSDDPSENI